MKEKLIIVSTSLLPVGGVVSVLDFPSDIFQLPGDCLIKKIRGVVKYFDVVGVPKSLIGSAEMFLVRAGGLTPYSNSGPREGDLCLLPPLFLNGYFAGFSESMDSRILNKQDTYQVFFKMGLTAASIATDQVSTSISINYEER